MKTPEQITACNALLAAYLDAETLTVSQFDYVRLTSGFEPVQCSCQKCANMCRKTPCMGTPEDINNIAEAGYGDRLAGTIWAAGTPYDIPTVKMVQPRYEDDRGCCTFFKDGLCELHDLGLKPTEGRLATCDQSKSTTPDNHPAFIIAEMWRNEFQQNGH